MIAIPRWAYWDRTLLAVLGSLAVVGFATQYGIASQASVTAPGFKLLLYYAIAGVALIVGWRIPRPWLTRTFWFWVALGISLALALAPFIAGTSTKGAFRWIAIPGAGVSVQPSELAKLAMIFAIAMLALSRQGLRQQRRDDTCLFRWLSVGVMSIIIAVLTALQPDTSGALVLMAVIGFTVMMADPPWKWVVPSAVALLVACVAFIMSDYADAHVQRRLEAFTSQDAVPSFQATKASEAIDAGGLSGLGLEEGRRKASIPDADSDFMLAAAHRNWGTAWAALIQSLVALLVFVLVSRSMGDRDVRDEWRAVVATGAAMLIAVPAVIHILVNYGWMPVTGQPVFMASRGGTFMVSASFLIGLSLNRPD